jgi:hypothetical protein
VASSLAHVMVVAGTRREWADLGAAAWQARTEELGRVVAAAGGAWLTLRVYETGVDGPTDAELPRQHLATADGQCTVIVDPVGDGRQRFAEAMRHVPVGAPVDE